MSSKKLLLILAIPLLVIGIIVYSFWYSSFRVASINPNPVPMSVTQIEFTFSRDIDQKYDTKKITLSNDKVKGSFSLTKNSIIFKPDDSMPKGQLTFNFPGVRSTTGEQMDFKPTVNVKYVPFNQLSREEQHRQTTRSDSFQGEFPITNGYVPHATAAWKVEYALPAESGVDKLTLMVTPLFDQGLREPLVDYQARLELVRTEFEAYLAAGNYKQSDYYIIYADPYLSKYDISSPEAGTYD